MGAKWFGASVKRKEDPALLTGRGRYVDDIALAGMLEAVVLRSPHAHAAIRGIDKRAAALKTRAAREKEAEIDIALGRLTATGTGGMGEWFKALAIADPRLGQLPGFYP